MLNHMLLVFLACVPSPGSLSPAECRAQGENGRVNVTCAHKVGEGYVEYSTLGAVWANPGDQCDDTKAIQGAIVRATAFQTVYLPSGKIQGGAVGKYIVSAPISIAATRVEGELHYSAGRGTTLKYVGPGLSGPPNDIPPRGPDNPAGYAAGAIIQSITHPAQLSNITVDCNGLVDYGVYYYRAHGSSSWIRNVYVKGCRMAGVFLDSSMIMSVRDLAVENSAQDGLVVVSGNSTQLSNIQARWNKRNGVVIAKRSGGASGGVSLTHGVIENNGSPESCDTSRPCAGIFVTGTTTPVNIRDMWIEGNYWDGVRSVGARNLSVKTSVVFGISASQTETKSDNYSMYFEDCQHCSVAGNVIGVGGKYFGYEDITFKGAHQYMLVEGNIYDSGYRPTHYVGGTAGAFEVVINGDGFGQHQRSQLMSAHPPTDGDWIPGDMVWNRSPTAGAASGWIYSGTEWLAIGVLAKISP